MKSDNSTNTQFFKTYKETETWLNEMNIKNYSINKDTLVVDVDGNVNLSNKNLNHIPVKFGKVKKRSYVNGNQNLKSLIGCPDSAISVNCESIRIKNFNGLGSVDYVIAHSIKSLGSFEGLPNKLEDLNITGSCHNVNSLDYFPKIIKYTLWIGPDFKWFDSLYKHMEMCSTIYLADEIGKYSNILKLLYVKGINGILSYTDTASVVTDILNAELRRQPDPRKRNLLKVAQELSNAGYHHLTV